jgi:ribosomal protein S18 acetylase RimI-like enzyme
MNRRAVEIRSATGDDVGAVLALWIEADAEPSHTDDAPSLWRMLADDRSALLVAVDGERLVGSVIAAWDGWRGSIYRLVVAPDHRRHGLGRRLLAAAEARLDDLGALRSQAIVVETDERATAFWRSSGWEQQTARLRFVRG